MNLRIKQSLPLIPGALPLKSGGAPETRGTRFPHIAEHESKESFRINWIGGIYANAGNGWYWEDTSPFDYSHFANGEGQAEPAKTDIFLEFNRYMYNNT